MFKELIYEQNVHWNKKKRDLGVERELLSKIERLFGVDHIIAITGIRRSGKSYLLRQIVNNLIKKRVKKENIFLMNLETPEFINYRDDPVILEKLYQTYLSIINPIGKVYVLLDEIQFIKNWEVWVKNKYDTNKGNIKFFITGSNASLLSSEFSTLLSGRIIEFVNYPFSFKEYLKSKNLRIKSEKDLYLKQNRIKNLFERYMKNGAMPEIVDKEDKYIIKEILSSYFYTIIYKDVIPRFSIRDSNTLEKIALYAITNTAREFSYNRVAKFLKSVDTTVAEYIRYLEKSYLLLKLKRLSASLKTQYSSIKKIYCIDTGFSNYLGFKMNEDKGRLLENLVFIELKRRGKEIYYHRGKKECDFVIKEGLDIVEAIQVTTSLEDPETRKREISGLVDAMKTYNLKDGLILTEDDEDEFIENDKSTGKEFKIKVLPVWKFLLSKQHNF